MKKSLAIIIATTLLAPLATPTAHAEDCAEKACIEVYTQNGQIVIEGRKGSGPSSKSYVAPAPRTVKKVAPRRVKAPAIAPTLTPKIKSTKRPVVRRTPRKAKPTSTSVEATSLQDKLVEILPTAGIAYQPSFEPLANTPVYFWSDIPEVVMRKISIVGEIVDVELRPTFIWHYGDGIFYETKKRGGPYPDGEIRHGYQRPGHYAIELLTIWRGSYVIEGVRYPINGSVESISILPITVVAAPTRFSSNVRYSK